MITVVAASGLALAAADAAMAQSASQVVPPSFRPSLERPGGFALPGAPGLATPPGAEKLSVRLSGVRVEGAFAEMAEATAALEARLTGKTITGADVFATARDLEAAYASAGYVLARVILPPQKLVNGSRLRLVVIDGYIERIELKDVPESQRRRIAALLAPLQGQRHLTQRQFERALLLAGDTPGVIMRSALAAGKAPGAAVLTIDAKYQSVSETASFDNSYSAALGRTVLGVGLDINSLAGLGELGYLRANGHPDTNTLFTQDPQNRTLAAGFVLPLWLDGLTFNPEVTGARTTPSANGVTTADQFDRLSLRLRYAFVRSRMFDYSQELAFDVLNENDNSLIGGAAAPLWQDRLRVFRFTQEGDVYTSWGAVITGRVKASFGIDGLGARSAADATPALPLSRQGANDQFQKLDGSLTYNQTLADHLAISGTARAQTSFNHPLLESELFGIADPTAVSAFDTATILGDQGYVMRGEVSSPWTVPLQNAPFGMIAAPYLFGAFGEVQQVNPTALEPALTHASAVGLGLRLGGAAPGRVSNGTLSIEYGRGRSENFSDAQRVMVTSSFRF